MSKGLSFVHSRRIVQSSQGAIFAIFAILFLVVLGIPGWSGNTAYSQTVMGPADDPYVPTHPSDKATAAARDLSAGAMTPVPDALTITSVDASEWPEIRAYVEALDQTGQPSIGLDADSFCVRQGSTDLESFSVTEIQGQCATSICLVIDVSSSMDFEGKLDSVKLAAHALVDQMGVLDRMALVPFSTCYQVLQDFTSNKALLHSKIDQLVGGGSTAVFDAIWEGVTLSATEVGSKAVIALSDGMENRSWECDAPPDGIYADDWTNDSTLIVGLARNGGAPIYTISIGDTFDPYYLEGFASGSGGDYYEAVTAGQISSIFSDIRSRLCSRYLISFTSLDLTLDGGCHDLVICRKDANGECTNCGETAWCEAFSPTITVDPLPCQPWEQDVDVCAEVTDADTPVDELQVRLFYRNSTTQPFAEVTMALTDGQFCGTIPAALLPCGGPEIQYYIVAYDGMSSVASPATGPSLPYAFDICLNTAPVCSTPLDSTFEMCDPDEVCLPFSANDVDGNITICELTYDGVTINIPTSGYEWCYTPSGSEFIDVTLHCVDACGAECEQTARFTFVIDQPPVLTCPQDIVTDCGSIGEFGTPLVQDENPSTVTLSVSQDSTAGSCAREYTLVRVWTATDECGKTVQCTQTIMVDDTTPPTIACPASLTVACTDEIPNPDISKVLASDECGGGIVVTHEGDTSPAEGVVLRTYRATDLCGNFSECVQTIDVDSTAPLAITCPLPIAVQCTAEIPPADINAVIVTGDCEGTATVTHAGDVSDGLSCPETVTRTYRVTDALDNTAECAQTIVIEDTTPPTITCPEPMTVSCPSEIPAVDVGSVIASDNCDGPVVITWLGDSPLSGSCPATITRTYQATDACGNAAECDQVFTVDDTTPPVISGVGDDIQAECPAEPLFSNPTVTDNCDSDPILTFEDVQTAGACVNVYTVVRTWTATDVCGNTSTATQTISVVDQSAPIIACPGPITVACLSEVPDPDINAVIASDDCGGEVNVTHEGDSPLSGTEIARTYRATDACGNFNECTQTIIIDDTAPLSITCPPPIVVQCTADIPSADIGAVTVTGDCEGTGIVTHVGDVSDGLSCPETITRTYRVTDAAENTAECTQTITIDDTTPPSISCPAPVTVSCLSDIPAVDVDAVTASDNCTAPVEITWLGDSPLSGSCPATITRTYQATDACGNATTCEQAITVDDTTPPVISGVGDDVEIECLDEPSFSSPSVFDNCDSEPALTFDDVQSAGICANEYTIVRTWTATDACGNTSTTSQTISVIDQTAPSITCPGPITVACANEIPDPNVEAVVASDDCGGAVTITHEGDTPPTDGVIVRTYRATDLCGNFSECTQTITIDDTAPLAIICPPSITVQCITEIPPADINAVIVTGGCEGTATVTHIGNVSDGLSCPEMILRTYRATDGLGNSAECTQVITVDDTTPPMILGIGDDYEIACSDEPIFSEPVATDNCDPAPLLNFADQQSVGSCPSEYSVTRTWTATDICGNVSFASQTITVRDLTAPSITCPDPITVACPGDIPDADVDAIIASDDCGGPVVITWSGDSPLSGHCPATIARTYQATDECGNVAECTQTITVDDTNPPVILGIGDDLAYDCSVEPVFSNPIVSDDCDAQPALTFEDQREDGTCAYDYTIVRTWTATDACGNTSSASQTITVHDQTPPSMTCAEPITVACPDDIPEPDITTVNASDDCGGPVQISWYSDSPLSGSCPAVVLRTYQATDECGNVAECTQSITVDDTTPPVISGVGNDLAIECSDELAFSDPSVSDNCDSEPTLTFEDQPSPGACPNGYAVVRTWTATDACGNTSTASQTVSVSDQTPPTITCADQITVACPRDIPEPDVSLVTATDNCDEAVEITWVGDSPFEGTCPATFTRTYSATDLCGNTAECTQTITVTDGAPLSLECPNDTTITISPQEASVNVEFSATTQGGCSETPISYDPPSGSYFPIGKTTVTCTVVDACTTATCSFSVTVQHSASPPFVRVPFDVKPKSCPNPLNIKSNGGQSNSNNSRSEQSDNAVLPAAILGTEDFDISTIDPASLRLNGVAPLRWAAEDVASPVVDGAECECTTRGADGYIDLTLKFDKDDLIGALGEVNNDDELTLTVTGELADGTQIVGADCVVIRKNPSDDFGSLLRSTSPDGSIRTWNQPNPFNSGTTINFQLSQDGQVDIVVYDVLGHRIATLLDDFRSAGQHSIAWDGRSSNGAVTASGMYFYRVSAHGMTVTRKMVLIK